MLGYRRLVKNAKASKTLNKGAYLSALPYQMIVITLDDGCSEVARYHFRDIQATAALLTHINVFLIEWVPLPSSY